MRDESAIYPAESGEAHGRGPSEEAIPLEALSARDVYAALGTYPSGLPRHLVEERLRQFGPNVIREVRKKSLFIKLLANFTHLMALLLWAGGLVAFLARMPELGFSILMVNIINGAFSFWQEFKAEKATEALRRLMPTWSRVVREGGELRVAAEELVPGDVILLSEGDRISADARLVEESELRVDQSTLTGESRHVRKTAEPSHGAGSARMEILNKAFAGTSVASGTGKAVVFATGMDTELGGIAGFTQSVGDEPSPLQKEMERVTRTVSLVACGMGIVFFLLAVAMTDIGLAEGFIFAMGMIVAFVPEGLLPTVTLSLAMGVQRMARRNALIKRLSAVETLGCTSVICTDKTGTLTQNEMTVREIWVAGRRLTVTGTGYAPEGEILDGATPLGGPATDDPRHALLAFALCNNSRLLSPEPESPRWTALGDLKVAAMKLGLDPEAEARRMPRLRELPFESGRKMMSTVHQAPDTLGKSPGAARPRTGIPGPESGERVAFVKGAPGEMLAHCSRILIEGREDPMDDEWRARITAANDDFARNGLRVLAAARRRLPAEARRTSSAVAYSPENIERDLTFLGLAAMMDPPRPEVAEAVQKCHGAGIRVVMITGDYGLTAESIARRIGVIQKERPRIVSGADLDAMSDEDLRKAIDGEVIFARVAPEHKLRIVTAIQSSGQVVAVTGDGVNDAPALKKADIGVAMGLCGTDVAKEAADMILTDDNFASIVNAIEEGRAVYANIKRFTTYIFTSNTPEAVPFILFALSQARIPLALNVMHILAVDLGTDLMPALALGAEPPEPGLMDRPPRSLGEHVITPALLARAYLWLGPVQSAAVMFAFFFQYWMSGYRGQWLDLPSSGPLYQSATGMALACVVTTQIGNLFAQRAHRTSSIRAWLFSNPLLWVGIASELVLILAIVYVPIMQRLIGTAAFSPKNWLLLFALAPLLLVANKLLDRIVR